MANVFLGIIAISALVIAAFQVAGILTLIRTIRQVGEIAGRFEQEVRPILSNLQKVSEEAARASALVSTQVERLDAVVASVAARVDDTAAMIQQTILQPVRDGMAALNALKNIVAGFRDTFGPRSAPAPARETHPAGADDELFIG